MGAHCSLSVRAIALSHQSVLLCATVSRSDGSAASVPVQHTVQLTAAPSGNSITDMFEWLNASGHANAISLDCEAAIVRPLLLQLANERDASTPIQLHVCCCCCHFASSSV